MVDLDAVSVRIGEVDRLADEVVGHPEQWHPVLGGVGEPAREISPLRHAQGEVVEPRVPPRPPRARLLDEAEQLDPVGTERGSAALSPDQLEADHAAVVAERAVELADQSSTAPIRVAAGIETVLVAIPPR